MSLAHRLKSAQRNQSNKRGCVTCQWWQSVSPDTQRLINEWLDSGSSSMQLHQILTTPSDDVTESELLRVSFSGFRMHLKHHSERCR